MLKKLVIASCLLSSTFASAAPTELRLSGFGIGNFFYDDILVQRLGVKETFETIEGEEFSKVKLESVVISCYETQQVKRPELGSNFDCLVFLDDNGGKTTSFGTHDDNHTDANILTVSMKNFHFNTTESNDVRLKLYRFDGSLSCTKGIREIFSYVCTGISRN